MITSSLPYCIISIHAPREGGDLDFLGTVLDFIISIHAPREGGDCRVPAHGDGSGEFQSTPPARGATRPGDEGDGWGEYFNPRPPRGGRPHLERRQTHLTLNFNPRPPRGGRLNPGGVHVLFDDFNPRPPRGGRH